MPKQMKAPDLKTLGKYGVGELDGALIRKSKEGPLFYVFFGEVAKGLQIAPVYEGGVISLDAVKITDPSEVYELVDKGMLSPRLRFAKPGA